MGLQVYQTQLPPPQTPLVKPDGTPTTDGRYLFLALWNRTGKGPGGPVIATGLIATLNTVAAGAAPIIAADWNVFSTVPNAGICTIPIVNVEADFIIWNFGAHSLAITPDPTQQIDALGLGNPYNLNPNKMQWFRCAAPNQLYSMQLG
jgi:hypothetical protein